VRAEPAAADGGGAVISAAVATTLLFTVENRDFHFYDPVTDFFSERAPFSYIGVGLLLALLAAYLVWQRFKFRISFGVERRE
jgi:multisubunit Na+/H+ antiporter MnhB subunit